MTIIGFNFSKISATRNSAPKGKISVNRSCKPTNVEEITIGGGQKALRYTFEFGVQYKPDIAQFDFAGKMVELVNDDEHQKILDSWEDNEQLPPKSLERVMNELLNRCHVEALLMAKELGVPPPIKLPSVKVQQKSEDSADDQ